MEMNIFELANIIGAADYTDNSTGYKFMISEWVKLGKPDTGIRVADKFGKIIGVITKGDDKPLNNNVVDQITKDCDKLKNNDKDVTDPEVANMVNKAVGSTLANAINQYNSDNDAMSCTYVCNNGVGLYVNAISRRNNGDIKGVVVGTLGTGTDPTKAMYKDMDSIEDLVSKCGGIIYML